MKCIECEKEAEFVFSGFSVCREHMEVLEEKTAKMNQFANFALKQAAEGLARTKGEI